MVGLPTNIEFLRRAVKHPAFIEGGVDTSFLTVRRVSCVCVGGVHALAATSCDKCVPHVSLLRQRLAVAGPPSPSVLPSLLTASVRQWALRLV